MCYWLQPHWRFIFIRICHKFGSFCIPIGAQLHAFGLQNDSNLLHILVEMTWFRVQNDVPLSQNEDKMERKRRQKGSNWLPIPVKMTSKSARNDPNLQHILVKMAQICCLFWTINRSSCGADPCIMVVHNVCVVVNYSITREPISKHDPFCPYFNYIIIPKPKNCACAQPFHEWAQSGMETKATCILPWVILPYQKIWTENQPRPVHLHTENMGSGL